MRLSLPEISAAELAVRIAVRQGAGDWLALLIADSAHVRQVADEVQAELQATNASAVASVRGAANAEDFIRQLEAHPDEVLMVSEMEDFSERDWQRIDLRRSDLSRSRCVVLISTRPTLERLLRNAPNLASWLSGSLWSWRPGELTAEELAKRLQDLRSATGRSDEEVLQMARTRSLPRDPQYAEWLILLGHGELL